MKTRSSGQVSETVVVPSRLGGNGPLSLKTRLSEWEYAIAVLCEASVALFLEGIYLTPRFLPRTCCKIIELFFSTLEVTYRDVTFRDSFPSRPSSLSVSICDEWIVWIAASGGRGGDGGDGGAWNSGLPLTSIRGGGARIGPMAAWGVVVLVVVLMM
jgi:hypothetical protein